MGRPCTVCANAECITIFWRLLRQVPRRAIAQEFGLSEAAVRRHAENHVAPELQAALTALTTAARQQLEELPERLARAAFQLESSANRAPRRRAVERCSRAVLALADAFDTLAEISRALPRS